MRAFGLLALGVLVGLAVYHVLGVTGVSAMVEHFHPKFDTPDLRRLAADENRKALEVIFGTIITLGGITLTCTVGYLSLPQERFSEAAQRLAQQAFGEMYQNREESSEQLKRAQAAIEKNEKSRPSLIALYTLISIHSIAPWTFRPCHKQLQALGNGLRNVWRGTRIAVFVRAGDVSCVAWLAGLTALTVLFAALFMVRLVALDAVVDGPWPMITDLAQLGALFTLVALVLVMGIAIARAVTAQSVRRAIEEAREQEEGRLADEATRLIDQTGEVLGA
ncbi:hypothetical protein IPV08_18910 [Methylobacterium sp. SD274]|jgi:hypothetical protein|uniref:Uncharacterized protein n=1 Tax=Methylobacterium gossipiicola TaxID=582675 RepID=A0A1I2UX50_9HYPH|nr:MULTISPECIES: hypothetical protein [Methylobacterium]KQO66569.1 hypothetical protein ASF18_13960 [Methylobacterium sp. Leaf89]MBO1022030.1 hypothetical protein [Methylobacterium sp. SD274]MBY0257438.1 hypothetical protein [Methylobacterium sp.]SFG81695.1 hypothetical protein SAMN05192565_11259 [Methylobacterium gossipiicola]